MLDFSWQEIKDDDFQKLVVTINKENEFELFSPETTRLQKAKTPFYKNLVLMEATEFAAFPPLTIRYIFEDGQTASVVKLDGSREAILEANKIENPLINEETVVAFAKFSLDSVMGEEGPFRLVESMEDVEFSREPTQKEEKMLAAAVKPARITRKDNKFELDACVLYSDCVYRAILTVTDNGEVDIEEEKVMLTEMPTRPIMLE